MDVVALVHAYGGWFPPVDATGFLFVDRKETACEERD
jgi:hypothetical protein